MPPPPKFQYRRCALPSLPITHFPQTAPHENKETSILKATQGAWDSLPAQGPSQLRVTDDAHSQKAMLSLVLANFSGYEN